MGTGGFSPNGGPGEFRTTFNFDFNNFDARNVFKDFFGGKDPFENVGNFGFGFEDGDMFKNKFKDPFGNDDFFKGMGTSGFMFNNMGGAGSSSGVNSTSVKTGTGGGKKTSIKKTTQTV